MVDNHRKVKVQINRDRGEDIYNRREEAAIKIKLSTTGLDCCFFASVIHLLLYLYYNEQCQNLQKRNMICKMVRYLGTAIELLSFSFDDHPITWSTTILDIQFMPLTLKPDAGFIYITLHLHLLGPFQNSRHAAINIEKQKRKKEKNINVIELHPSDCYIMKQ